VLAYAALVYVRSGDRQQARTYLERAREAAGDAAMKVSDEELVPLMDTSLER
jgi:hypothetical protein